MGRRLGLGLGYQAAVDHLPVVQVHSVILLRDVAAAMHGELEDLLEKGLQLLLGSVELREDLLQEREVEGCVDGRGRVLRLLAGQIHESGDLVGDAVTEMPVLLFEDLVQAPESSVVFAGLLAELHPVVSAWLPVVVR